MPTDPEELLITIIFRVFPHPNVADRIEPVMREAKIAGGDTASIDITWYDPETQ